MTNSDGPTTIGARHDGTVIDFDVEVGLGGIETSSGQRWIFHCTQIADGSRNIDVGRKVTFVIGAGAPGQWEAFDIDPSQAG